MNGPVRASALERFPRSELEQSLGERFAAQARRRPEALAVRTSAGEELTYAELDAASNRVAHALLERLGAGSEPVVLLLGQGAALVAAILGTLRAGKLYAPLDGSHPPGRLAPLVGQLRSRLILADAQHRELARRLAGTQGRVLEADALGAGLPEHDPGIAVGPGDPAYVYVTSGSTGIPKGVVDCHRNVLHNVMRYTTSLGIGADDRLTLLQGPSFSGAVSSLFCALLNGASSHPYDLAREGAGPALGAWLAREEPTVYHSVPALFRSICRDGAFYPSVRVVRLEGDAASGADAELFRRHFRPGCLLQNGLGATETGLSCQFLLDREQVPEGGVLPIGWPTEDMEVVLVDERGDEVAPGEAGEITVRSAYLALGYWGDDELTAARFRPDPADPARRIYRTGDTGRRRADGCIEFLGRTDGQVKVRGQRVEPAEVEAALLRLEGVREAVVTTYAAAAGEGRLAAYVVGTAPAPELRRLLADRLPAHLVPTDWVFLDSLPLNENGKVDRRALPAPRPPDRGSAAAPHDELERAVAEAFANALAVRPVGSDDDFFELGGDSITAAILLGELQVSLGGRKLPQSLLLEAPTPSSLAQRLREESPHATAALVPLLAGGAGAPFVCVHGFYGHLLSFGTLARRLGRERPFFGIQATWPSRGEAPASLEELAARYVAELTAAFPEGPYVLGGYCFGGVVAFEMGQQLAAGGREVALVALLDALPGDYPGLVPDSLVRRTRKFMRRDWARGYLAYLRRAGALPAGLVLARTASRRARRLLGRRPGTAEGGAAPAALVERVHRGLSSAYRPRRFPGDLAVFVASATRPVYRGDLASAWSELAEGQVRVHVLDCKHSEMFLEPQVAALASQLGAELAAAESERRDLAAPVSTL